VKKSKRKFVVFTSLVGLLTLTSALLLALAPPPLAAEAGYNTLAASDRSDFLEDIFKTTVTPKTDQWKYIYIHQSATPSGSAATLALPDTGLCDHFIIGNGDGCPDGEIQMCPRWNQQQPPVAPDGVAHIEPDCISICLVGDYDKSSPTPIQLKRLTQLVSTLQSQLRITGQNVVLLNDSPTASSVGRYFPITVFRDQILP
jgi:hypothetical protein